MSDTLTVTSPATAAAAEARTRDGGPVLEALDLRQTFSEGPQAVTVLRGISFSVARGERIAIIGRSGSGKTTLLHLLGGLEQPSEGRVRLLGQDLSGARETDRSRLRNRHMGFVYQLHHLLPEFTALENVAMPVVIGGGSVAEAEQAATALLERVGLGQRLHHKPAELSGGERQRVALARALVTRPAVVLADEPTGNLDRDTAESIHQLIVELNESLGTSFVIVTHEDRLAALAHRRLRMEQGLLAEC
ncbi:lipoprotein-releasing ABC transporter ATP-binding protein LolD [Amnimonas aquatica]|uniref:Lipoprotein-releasing system ATP-binding protein LolD n=1 Tax=Amnimonas aquatica TaxID=2094561 RepID=A0A2P6AR77_9GAMM|nr:lipoprotein-releasing ABC transporter ATP-binding protein LolD [Amnimonas aquatica]PQA36439.1 lipoprotein-releasing ABC transporter ATP-binding protein LolD [Amnimonas aquatica]